MPLQRADICILRRSARAHRTLAQIDFFKDGLVDARVVIEQRTLSDRLPDRAFDVALRQIVIALGLFVETLQNHARLLAGRARALDGDMIAALLGHDAETALHECEGLAVLAEQNARR